MFAELLSSLESRIMSALSDIATKIAADIEAKLANMAADKATIAELQAKVAALEASDADTQAAIATLTAADDKLLAG